MRILATTDYTSAAVRVYGPADESGNTTTVYIHADEFPRAILSTLWKRLAAYSTISALSNGEYIELCKAVARDPEDREGIILDKLEGLCAMKMVLVYNRLIMRLWDRATYTRPPVNQAGPDEPTVFELLDWAKTHVTRNRVNVVAVVHAWADIVGDEESKSPGPRASLNIADTSSRSEATIAIFFQRAEQARLAFLEIYNRNKHHAV